MARGEGGKRAALKQEYNGEERREKRERNERALAWNDLRLRFRGVSTRTRERRRRGEDFIGKGERES